MSTSTDWSSRPISSAMSPVRLAAFVDRSLARTEGLLFTATPAEELDAIGRWQQLKDQAFAGQMREIVAAFNGASQWRSAEGGCARVRSGAAPSALEAPSAILALRRPFPTCWRRSSRGC